MLNISILPLDSGIMRIKHSLLILQLLPQIQMVWWTMRHIMFMILGTILVTSPFFCSNNKALNHFRCTMHMHVKKKIFSKPSRSSLTPLYHPDQIWSTFMFCKRLLRRTIKFRNWSYGFTQTDTKMIFVTLSYRPLYLPLIGLLMSIESVKNGPCTSLMLLLKIFKPVRPKVTYMLNHFPKLVFERLIYGFQRHCSRTDQCQIIGNFNQTPFFCTSSIPIY